MAEQVYRLLNHRGISADVAFGSALRAGARYEGEPATVGAGVVSFRLMKGLTMRRTIAHMNPPAAVPHLTRADT
jgi:hypothetical protein